MGWKKLLAYITGSVDEEVLLRHEYLAAENRILRRQIEGRVGLTDADRRSLAEIGQKLGRAALSDVASIVTPNTILGWHRKWVAKKFDGSANRTSVGRPKIDQALEDRVVRLVKENRSWGYDRIVGVLSDLGHDISDQTVANILKRHGIVPAPEREKLQTWSEFVRLHKDLLVATDFFSTEVGTCSGLTTYYMLFFIHISTRQVRIAGITPNPNEPWMMPIARNETMADGGFLKAGQYLIHDRDGKYGPAFQRIIDDAGIERIQLPPRSPNLNAHAERWVQTAKNEVLSNVIRFGEASLRRALTEFDTHVHFERPHQGIGNVIPMKPKRDNNQKGDKILCRERLGGLLKYYYREAA